MKVFQKADGGVLQSGRDYDIGTSTNIGEGQVVALSEGLVIAAIQKQTGKILGIAAENHSGSADALNTRNDGPKIQIWDAPDAIFQCPAPVVAATGGSATTVTASTLGAFSNDDFNGGYLKLVEKAANSTNTDPVGKVYRITDYAYNSTGTVSTFTKASGGAPSAGDKYAVFPPVGFTKGQFDSGKTKLDLTDTCTLAMKVVGRDEDAETVLMMANLHVLGVEE